jgi:hypothetical protein
MTEPEEPTEPTAPAEPGTEPVPDDVQGLLDQAAERFSDAQAALQAGDFAEYGRLIEEVGELIERAQQAAGGGEPATTTTTTTAPAQET